MNSAIPAVTPRFVIAVENATLSAPPANIENTSNLFTIVSFRPLLNTGLARHPWNRGILGPHRPSVNAAGFWNRKWGLPLLVLLSTPTP